VISTTAAQLAAQLAALAARVREASVAHLEWQIRPGEAGPRARALNSPVKGDIVSLVNR
jgi:hypothetical protein